MTSSKDLGEITLSTFKGEDGPLAKEVSKVLDWFKKNDIEYINSIPSCDFEYFQNYENIFEKKAKGDIHSRLFNQFLMILIRYLK